MAQKQNTKAHNWAFTWFDYTDNNIDYLTSLKEDVCQYIVFGIEECPESGRMHLQGYVEFAKGPFSRDAIKCRLDPTKGKTSSIHLEPAKKCRDANATYCKKGGDYTEVDNRPLKKKDKWGKALEDLKLNPDIIAFAELHPDIAFKHTNGVERIANHLKTDKQLSTLKDEMADIKLYIWQKDLLNELEGKPNNRSIIWYADGIGNSGKTFFAKYLVTKGACYLQNGKLADLAHAYNGERIAIFDFTRSVEGVLNYSAIETIKNGMLFSPKYNSKTKIFTQPHVVVFANFAPDVTKMSSDRWDIRQISKDNCRHPPATGYSLENSTNDISKLLYDFSNDNIADPI